MFRALLLALRLGYHCGMNMARDQEKRRVVVVGAGIIGAAFAWHLARAGADVQVVDGGSKPGGLATANSWAWINASWGNAKPYFDLRHRSMALWRELANAVPDLKVNWCGGLLWDLPESELVAFAQQQSEWGYAAKLVNRAEALQIEPQLSAPPEMAVHVAGEGMVEPVAANAALVQAAQALGAKFHWGKKVERLIVGHGSVKGVVTPSEIFRADDVIVAAGLGSVFLLQQLGINSAIDGPPGLLVHSRPMPPLLQGLVMSPRLHVRQTAEGQLVAGSDFGGMEPGDDPAGAAQRLFGEMQKFLKGGRDFKFGRYSIGYRPTPRDGVSAIGRVSGIDGVYLCVSHSGITLAPVLGALGAQEILTGKRDDLLLPFGPERLLLRS